MRLDPAAAILIGHDEDPGSDRPHRLTAFHPGPAGTLLSWRTSAEGYTALTTDDRTGNAIRQALALVLDPEHAADVWARTPVYHGLGFWTLPPAAPRHADPDDGPRVCLTGRHLRFTPDRAGNVTAGRDCPGCTTRPTDFPPLDAWTIGGTA